VTTTLVLDQSLANGSTDSGSITQVNYELVNSMYKNIVCF